MEAKSLIPTALPQVFRSFGPANPVDALEPVKADSQWVDSVAHISQFANRSIPQARQQFELMLRSEQNASHRAVLYAGIARCLNSQMMLTRGAELLGYAWTQLDHEDADCSAFVQLEMVRFLVIVGNSDAARLMLEHILRGTRSEYLLRMAEYYRLADAASQGSDVIPALQDSADWFLERGQRSATVSHLRMISALRRVAGDDEAARDTLERAMLVSEGDDLRFCRALVHNDLGQLAFHGGDRPEAFRNLYAALDLAEYPYSRIDTLDLIGRFLRDSGEHTKAIEYLTEALDIAEEQGTIIILPALNLYLGECNEALQQTAVSRFFYRRASQSAMELLEHGFPATATRLRAIREFNRICAVTGQEEAPQSSRQDWSFAMSHTLRDIRTMFQQALLSAVRQKAGSLRDASHSLGIAERTANNVIRRYRELGSPDPDPVIVDFVSELHNLNWKDSNQRFDDAVLTRLAEYYGNNRRKMSEQLHVSYQHLSAMFSDTRKRLQSCGKEAP